MGIDPLTTATALATLGGISNYLYHKGTTSMAKSAYAYAKRSTKRRRAIKRRSTRPTRYAKKAAYTKKKRYSRFRSNRSNLKAVHRQLLALSKSVKSDQARHTHRHRQCQVLAGAVNQAKYAYTNPIGITELEAVMSQLRYYDPSVPGTLVSANAATGTYTRQIHFDSMCSKLLIRPNAQVPALVTIWQCTPRDDTNLYAGTWYVNGAADQGPSLTVDSPLLWPTDIKQVTENWKLKRVFRGLVKPGVEKRFFWKAPKPFDYDPSLTDVHTQEYQSKYHCFHWLIRVEGTVGHDNNFGVTGEVSSIQAGLDIQVDNKYVMTYDAGVNLDDYSIDNDASTSFTNAGVVSQPTADNQTYSIA